MSRRTRMRRIAVWLALALALWLPLAAAAVDKDDSDDDEQADEAPATKSHAKKADKDDEGEEKATDWTITHKGLYLIGQGSYSFMTADSDLENRARDASGEIAKTNGHVDGSWGYGGRIGYRFLDWLAAEGQAQVLNDIEIKLHNRADGTESRTKATFFQAMANAKGYLLTDRFQPYVLGGVGYGYAVLDPPGDNSKDRSSGFVAQFGVGADYYVTDNLGLMTEVSYAWPAGGVNDYDHVTISFGAMLRFYGEK
ncbi:MAG TPA: porin family protein [Myxococcota bacterium]|nr:porin family protein [Myxococcota bacterium]